jgi:hypothetical protein
MPSSFTKNCEQGGQWEGLCLKMGNAVRELVHGLCQWGEPIRNREATHLVHLQDMDQVDGQLVGTRIQTDKKFGVKLSPPKSTMTISCRGEMMRQQKKQPWRVHQSLSWTAWGRYCQAKCPRIEKSKASMKCSYDTFMRCKECSASAGCNVYLCNGNKGGKMSHCVP